MGISGRYETIHDRSCGQSKDCRRFALRNANDTRTGAEDCEHDAKDRRAEKGHLDAHAREFLELSRKYQRRIGNRHDDEEEANDQAGRNSTPDLNWAGIGSFMKKILKRPHQDTSRVVSMHI
jgi:hypothetical protein